MFSLSTTAIESEALKRELVDKRAGAFTQFEGWVRNNNDGKSVVRLEYEAFEPLAGKEAERIIAEAQERFDVIAVHCVHRIGCLEIGEVAVWIGVVAAHRADAFKACRYVIDQIKVRVPIWKKEYYDDGSSNWVNCASCTEQQHEHDNNPIPVKPGITESEFYDRQLLLAEVGASGQRKLKQARVLIVGAGGLGSPVLQYLASAGIGLIGICEFDRLEASNLHRQTIYSYADLGKPKVDLAAAFVRKLNPFVEVVTYAERFDAKNAGLILKGYDLVLDCADNFATKLLLSDACVVAELPLVQASVYQYEGQIQVYNPASNSACLRCHWKRVSDNAGVGACTQVGVLGVVPGVLGALQSNEALKIILGLPGVQDQNLVLINLLTLDVQRIKRKRAENCTACGVRDKAMSDHHDLTKVKS